MSLADTIKRNTENIKGTENFVQVAPNTFIPVAQVENFSTQAEIFKLKKQLESTDYKVIKCAECQLVGEELPYDMEIVHSERQALRNQINELEN